MRSPTRLFLSRSEMLDKPHCFADLLVRKSVVCNDGLMLSVQASANHFCEPMVTLCGPDARKYVSVEIMELSGRIPELDEYRQNGICDKVPVKYLDHIIRQHGGINYERTVAGK